MAVEPRLAAAGGLAAAAVGIATYLTSVHYSGAPLACAQNSVVNCDLVTRSAYGLVPGTAIPVSAAGIAWAGGSALLVGLAAARRDLVWPPVALAAWALVGTAAAVYLVRAEAILGHLCEWCTAFHVCVAGTLLLAIATVQLDAARRAEARRKP